MIQRKLNQLLLQVLILILSLGLLPACGTTDLTPTPFTPVPPTATIKPTATATQTATATLTATVKPTATVRPTRKPVLLPTSTLVPGIGEPVTLKEQGIKFLILGVDWEVGKETGLPQLIIKFAPPFDITDARWIANNSQLICGATTYQTHVFGFYIDQGKIAYYRLAFDVPEDINLSECILQVNDDTEIPLEGLP